MPFNGGIKAIFSQDEWSAGRRAGRCCASLCRCRPVAARIALVYVHFVIIGLRTACVFALRAARHYATCARVQLFNMMMMMMPIETLINARDKMMGITHRHL